MARKKHTPEEIIGKLCEAEVAQARGGTVADACHRPRHRLRTMILTSGHRCSALAALARRK